MRVVANVAARSVPSPQYAFLAIQTTTPRMAAYRWDYSSAGFGTRYANPATVANSTTRDVAVASDNAEVAFPLDSSPYVTAYPWSDSGWGTKFSDPADLPNQAGQAVAFNSNASVLFVTYNATVGLGGKRIAAYAFSSSGFGTKYSDISEDWSNANSARKFDVRTGDGYVAGSVPSGFSSMRGFTWSNSTGWGSLLSNPATTPTGDGYDGKFSPSGNDWAWVGNNSPYVLAYPFTTGFGTKYANPSTLPGGNGRGVRWSRDGSVIAVSHLSSPYLTVYAWSSGFSTKYADPASGPGSNSYAVDFSKNDKKILISVENSPYVAAWEWDGGFGTKMAAPSSTPENFVLGVKLSF